MGQLGQITFWYFMSHFGSQYNNTGKYDDIAKDWKPETDELKDKITKLERKKAALERTNEELERQATNAKIDNEETKKMSMYKEAKLNFWRIR